MLRYDNNPRGLLRIKRKKTPTEYNLLDYCVLLSKGSFYGANFRNTLKLIAALEEINWMK